jgi:hypothetical protein
MRHSNLIQAPQIAAAMQKEPAVPRDAEQLRELAAWYRDCAERTGNPAIWDARVRTAEELEAEAFRLEALSAGAAPRTALPRRYA